MTYSIPRHTFLDYGSTGDMTKKKTQKKQAKKTTAKKKTAKKKAGKKKVGRRRLLEKSHLQIQQKIVRELKKGHYIETACILAGISKAIYYRWMERGEREVDRLVALENEGVQDPEIDPNETIYVEFLDAVQHASAHAENDAVTTIHTAAKKDYKAAMLFLERRFHDRWKKRDKMEFTGKDDEPIRVQVYLPENSR